MDLIKELSAAIPVREKGGQFWRISIDEEGWIARAFQCDEFEVERLPYVPGVSTWRRFRPLSSEEQRTLELGGGSWLVALRPEVQGTRLSVLSEQAKEHWLEWGVRIATSIRALHAQGYVHGALGAEKIIIDAQQRPWLVDLPLFPGGSDVLDAESPTPATDVYALAKLISWMASGGESVLMADEVGTRRLRGAVKRSLSENPRLRPPVQDLIDGLKDSGAEMAPPFVALPPSLYRKLERAVLGELDEGQQSILLTGDEGTGRSFALERVFTRCQLSGRRSVYWSEAALRGPKLLGRREVSSNSEPWEPLRQLIAALDEDGNSDLPTVTGDRLHVFATWTDRLRQALPEGDTLLLWDDFDVAAPDIRAFWAHWFKTQGSDVDESSSESRLSLLATTSPKDSWSGAGHRIPLSGPDLATWTGWRVRTLLAEVREIPSARWEELVQTHGTRPVHLFEAINSELGTEKPSGFASRRPPLRTTPDVSVIFARDWRRHVEKLLEVGAYTQLVGTCRQLYEVLKRSGPTERIDILEVWMEGVMRIGWDPSEVAALEAALQSPTEDVLLARLYFELGRYSQGLAALDDGPPGGVEIDSERARWRAQNLLSSGRIEEARRVAKKGLERLTRREGQLFCHLSMIYFAAGAMLGDDKALGALRDLGPSLSHQDVPPQLRWRTQEWRAVGLMRRGEFELAAEASVRALEEVESAGFLGEMPRYLLHVGRIYHRQGRLGLAREYLARGSRLAGEATDSSTRALLLANEADIEFTLGRFEESRLLVERALAISEELDSTVISVRCRSLAGDIAVAEQRAEEALPIYESAFDDETIGAHQRARLLLGSAEAFLQLERCDEVRGRIEEARRSIEAGRLADLESLHGILRARHQWVDGKTPGTMASIELFRRHLLRAAEAGNHRLVFRQSPFLWEKLKREELPGLLEEVREVVNRSKEAVASGLTRHLRKDFFSRWPSLKEKVGGDRLSEMILELDSLEELSAEAIEKLNKLLSRRESGGGRRGRKPKARREDVVEALRRFDDDHGRTAEFLGVSERTLYRYLNRYAIE